MEKLLLLLCAIGANAAFADTVNVNCSIGDISKGEPGVVNVEIARLTGTPFSRQQPASDSSFMRFLSFTGNYDKYLEECTIAARGTQKVLGLEFINHYNDIKYIPVNEKYDSAYDLFKGNPLLAAFAEVKAFGDLVKSGDLHPISQNKNLSVKLKEYDPNDDSGFHYISDINSWVGLTGFRKLNYSKGYIFKTAIYRSSSTKKGITSDQAEAVGLFLSRYLHANNGLLDNLPFSYGLTENKTDNALSEVEIEVEKKTENSIFLVVRLYLKPTRLINKKYNMDVMAVLAMPLVLNLKDYKLGNENQKLTIAVPKTGPLVEFYKAKTGKPVDDKTNSEFLGLMALGMTNLKLSESSSNSDTFKSVDLIKKP